MTAPEVQPRPWVWTPQKLRAAHLLAHREGTDSAIAKKVGCHRSTLWRWFHCPEFAEMVREQQREYLDMFREQMHQSIANHYRQMAAEAEVQAAARRAQRQANRRR